MALSTIVSTSAQLLAALAQAHSGDTILLAPGNYSPVEINNFQANTVSGIADGDVPVVIRSEFSNQQAVLGSVKIASSSGLSFSDIKDSTAGIKTVNGGGDFTSSIGVDSSSQITFSSVSVYGQANSNYMTDITGIIFKDSSQVLVTGSSFENLHAGIIQSGDDNVIISSNMFGYIDDDAMHSVGTSNITITKNFITDQHYNASDAEHPDAIQFYTQGSSSPASNITITDNTIIRGTGNAVQGIFFRDEVGDLPYTNVLIEGNDITGEEYNGIYVNGVESTRISNNDVNSYSDFVSEIKVIGSDGVTVDNNSAGGYEFTDDTNTVNYGNRTNGSIDDPAGPTTTQAVPEPAAWIFMLLGFASLGLVARRARLAKLTTRMPFAVPT